MKNRRTIIFSIALVLSFSLTTIFTSSSFAASATDNSDPSGSQQINAVDSQANATDNALGEPDPSPNESSNDSQFSGDISAMEMRFFEREYPNETISQRLDRIERLIYGTKKTGSTQQRITRLLLDVPHLGDGLSKSDPAVEAAAAQPKTDDAQQNIGTQQAFKYPNEPRSLISEVSAMENEVYGKTYASDTLVDRVNRLEKTVFAGRYPQTFTPITTRINRLMLALQPKFSAPTSVYTTPSANESRSAYPPLAPSYSKANIPTSDYPTPNTAYSYNSKYDYSRGSTENKYGNNNYNASNFMEDTTGDTKKDKDKEKDKYKDKDKDKYKDVQKKGHPFLHKLGHFMGEVGEAAGVTAGAIAAGSMMGYGYGGYGFGYPGFGYGGWGMPYYGGFGGRPFMGYW